MFRRCLGLDATQQDVVFPMAPTSCRQRYNPPPPHPPKKQKNNKKKLSTVQRPAASFPPAGPCSLRGGRGVKKKWGGDAESQTRCAKPEIKLKEKHSTATTCVQHRRHAQTSSRRGRHFENKYVVATNKQKKTTRVENTNRRAAPRRPAEGRLPP